MRNNNNLYDNFFSVLKLNPLRTFHVESLTSPVTPCHVRLCTYILYECYEILIRDWVTLLLPPHHSSLVAYDFSVGRVVLYYIGTRVVFVCLGVFVNVSTAIILGTLLQA